MARFGIVELIASTVLRFRRGANTIDIRSPATITTSYAYTLPANLPGSLQAIAVDTTGQWSYQSLSGGGATDWANPGTIGSATPNTGVFTALTANSLTLRHLGNASIPLLIGTYQRDTEYGITVPMLRVSGGRFDFAPLDNKAEFRVSGAATQFNIFNVDQGQFYFQVNADRTVNLFNTLSVAGGITATGVISGQSLALTGSLSQGLFLASPAGASGSPTFRALAWLDVSALAGTSASSFAVGNDSRLSDARTPIAGSVVDSSVATGAAISWTKISKSGAVASDVGAQASNTRLSSISNRANPTTIEEVRLNTDGTIGYLSITSPRDTYGHRPQVAVSANKTIAASDLGTLQYVTAASAVTIPTDATGGSAFTSGNVEFEIFVDTTGAVSIAAAAGVTIVYRNAAGTPSTGTVTSAGQYSFLFAKRIAANRWAVTGSTT